MRTSVDRNEKGKSMRLGWIVAMNLSSAIAPIFAGPKAADTVFLNGAVYTVNATQPTAAAVAIAQGRIVYVGADDTARQYVGRKTRVIDLQGRTLLPGFQDSHLHPGDVPNPGTTLDLGGLKTREEIFERIRHFAASHPGKAWIVGTGWDEAAFLPSGQPTREMLDAARAGPTSLPDEQLAAHGLVELAGAGEVRRRGGHARTRRTAASSGTRRGALRACCRRRRWTSCAASSRR